MRLQGYTSVGTEENSPFLIGSTQQVLSHQLTSAPGNLGLATNQTEGLRQGQQAADNQAAQQNTDQCTQDTSAPGIPASNTFQHSNAAMQYVAGQLLRNLFVRQS